MFKSGRCCAAAIAEVCLITAAVTITAGAAAYIILGAAAQTGIATVMIGAAAGGVIAGSINIAGQAMKKSNFTALFYRLSKKTTGLTQVPVLRHKNNSFRDM